MGGRRPVIDDDEILSVLETSDDPFLSAAEVSERLSIGREGTKQRLFDLADDGVLCSRKVSDLVWVFWLPERAE